MDEYKNYATLSGRNVLSKYRFRIRYLLKMVIYSKAWPMILESLTHLPRVVHLYPNREFAQQICFRGLSFYIDGLMQVRGNPIAIAMELRLFALTHWYVLIDRIRSWPQIMALL